MAELVSLREFARRKNWNPGYAHKLKEAGRLVMAGDKVDVEASLRRLEESADPARAHLRRGAAAEPDAPAEPEPASSGGPGGVPLSANATFNKARTAAQVFDARMRELDYKERVGELVSARDVEQMQFTAGRITRDRLLMVPPRFAAEIHALVLALLPDDVRSAIADKFHAHDCEQRMHAVIRDALSEAERAIEEAARGDDGDDE